MKVDPDRIIPLAHITELAFPPMDLHPQSLKELYLEVSNSHNFPEFKLLDGNQGATFGLGSRRQLSVLRDRLIVKDDFTEVTFESYMDSALDLVERTRIKLGIPVFVTQTVVIRHLVPIESPGPVAHELHQSLLNIDEESLRVFNRPLSGIGLRAVFPPTTQDATEFQLRIEPYFRDPKMIFLEVIARFLFPCQDREGLLGVLRRSYKFLREDVATFLRMAADKSSP